jgi:hypothetical protein
LEDVTVKHSAPLRSRKRRAAQARRLRHPQAPAQPAENTAAARGASALERQNNDLTAEGSPPPGKVGLAGPATPQ